MSYYNTQNKQGQQLTHKQIILQQILICNNLFSGYEITPSVINQQLGTYDFVAQAHTARGILLGVLTLEANSRAILPNPFNEHAQQIKQRIFTKGNYADPNHQSRITNTYKFLAPNPTTQLDGILEIYELYREILDAIYSLPKFSDAINFHQFAKGEDNIKEEDLQVRESIEYPEGTVE